MMQRPIIKSSITILIATFLGGASFAEDRPNILYITLEDITPMMGCYGDDYAKTPVFDKLASEGIRYTYAHSVAPVCSCLLYTSDAADE